MKKEKKEKTLAQELGKVFTRQTGMFLEQIRLELRNMCGCAWAVNKTDRRIERGH